MNKSFQIKQNKINFKFIYLFYKWYCLKKKKKKKWIKEKDKRLSVWIYKMK